MLHGRSLGASVLLYGLSEMDLPQIQVKFIIENSFTSIEDIIYVLYPKFVYIFLLIKMLLRNN